MAVITPYFRTILESKGLACEEEADTNYTPYLLFCLKSRLYPIVEKIIGPGIDVRFQSEQINSRMVMCLSLYRGKNRLELTSQQEEILSSVVNIITTRKSNYCLIFSSYHHLIRKYKNKISADWLTQMLPFIDTPNNHPEGIDIYCGDLFEDIKDVYVSPLSVSNFPLSVSNFPLSVSNFPLSVSNFPLSVSPLSVSNFPLSVSPLSSIQYPTSPKAIFGNLSTIINYSGFIAQMAEEIREELDQMYSSGYILSPESDVVTNWKLKPANLENDLYFAPWKDSRFAPDLVDFLISRSYESPRSLQNYISIFVGENMVNRHFVASTLLASNVLPSNKSKISFRFNETHVKIECNTLVLALKLASLVDSALVSANGVILPIPLSQEKMIDKIPEILNKLKINPLELPNVLPVIAYRVENPETPWIVSCLLPLYNSSNISYLYSAIEKMLY